MSDNYENNNLNEEYIENYYNSPKEDTETSEHVNSSQSETSEYETSQPEETSAEYETIKEETQSETQQSESTYHFTGSQIPSDNSYNSTSYSNQGYNYNNYYQGNSNYGSSYNNQATNYNSNYSSNSYTNSYSNSYGTGVNQTNYPYNSYAQKATAPKPKKEKKPVTRGALAIILIVSIVCSGVLGIGGGFIAARYFGGSSITINKTTSSGSNQGSASASKNDTGALSTTEIVAKTAESVVEITTETVTTGSFFQQYVAQGAGSGVIISKDGYILTNNHVIDGANTVKVTTKDGTEYDAEVIGADSKLDVALIKVDATELSPATFGDSSTIMVGDYAVAIGNPLGRLGGTVTDGIISALDRDVSIDGETMRLLQTNAAINPGNSGGGLFNANGELIGIVCAKAQSTSSNSEAEGLGFAIPINNVLDVLNDLKEYGYVKGRIDLGMTLTNVQSSTVYQQGVYVSSVTSGSNADKAGFQSGDLITAVNGTAVTSVSNVNEIIDNLSVGDTVKFSVTRGTRSGELSFTLEEYNPDQDVFSSNNDFYDERGNSIWDYFNW